MGDWGGGWKKIYRDFQGRPICQIGGMMLVMTMMYDGEVLTSGFMVKLMMMTMMAMMMVMMMMKAAAAVAAAAGW